MPILRSRLFPASAVPRLVALLGGLSLLATGLAAAPARGVELGIASSPEASVQGAAPPVAGVGPNSAILGSTETFRLLASPPTGDLGAGIIVELSEGRTGFAAMRSGAGSVLVDEAAGISAILGFDDEGCLSRAEILLRRSPGTASPEGPDPEGELILELRRVGMGLGVLDLRDSGGALLARAELRLGDPRLAGGIRYARFLDVAGEVEAELELHADSGGRLSALSIRRAAAEGADPAGPPGEGAAGPGKDVDASGAEDPLALVLSLFPALDPLGPVAAATMAWSSGFVPTSSSFVAEGSVEYVYDAAGRPSLALARDGEGALVERLSLRYDERGLLVEELREPGPAAASESASGAIPAAASPVPLGPRRVGAASSAPAAGKAPAPAAAAAVASSLPAPLRLVHSYELGPDGTWRVRLSHEVRAERGGMTLVLVKRIERRTLP